MGVSRGLVTDDSCYSTIGTDNIEAGSISQMEAAAEDKMLTGIQTMLTKQAR